MRTFLKLYRALPVFKGKFRIGKMLFAKYLNKRSNESFTAHEGIRYMIPNTIENLYAELLVNGVYEQRTLDVLCSEIFDGAVFFDVGANVGSIGIPTCLSAMNVKYYAFEATPETSEFLRKNLEANRINGAIINKIVSDKHGVCRKLYVSQYAGKNSLAPVYSTESIDVETITLDEFCAINKIGQIDLLKIDVQGYELEVFNGAVDLLSKKAIKTIAFEFEDWAEDSAGVPRGSAQLALMNLGYKIFNYKGELINAPIINGRTMLIARGI